MCFLQRDALLPSPILHLLWCLLTLAPSSQCCSLVWALQGGQHPQSTCVLVGGVDLPLLLIWRRKQTVLGQKFVRSLEGPSQTRQASPWLSWWAMLPAQR